MSNKTSDKNVANIEDDVRLIKRYLEDSSYKESDSDFFKNGGWEIIDLEIPRAIENILAEREQDKKRIQELEEERDHWHGCFVVAMENSIPKQVVIDKVNEINKKYEDSKDENGESPYFYPDFTIRILQKLLEGEK